jgi:hypothetical protein
MTNNDDEGLHALSCLLHDGSSPRPVGAFFSAEDSHNYNRFASSKLALRLASSSTISTTTGDVFPEEVNVILRFQMRRLQAGN